MPWRLVLFLIALTIFALFAGFNASYTASISVGFHTFTGVPVFVSVFFAFLLGAIVVLPFAFGRRFKKGAVLPKKNTGSAKKDNSGNTGSDSASAPTTISDRTETAHAKSEIGGKAADVTPDGAAQSADTSGDRTAASRRKRSKGKR